LVVAKVRPAPHHDEGFVEALAEDLILRPAEEPPLLHDFNWVRGILNQYSERAQIGVREKRTVRRTFHPILFDGSLRTRSSSSRTGCSL
jgi:hypothetical protein